MSVVSFKRFKVARERWAARQGHCWLFHEWSTWVDLSEGYSMLTQKRYCRHCNKAQIKTRSNWS